MVGWGPVVRSGEESQGPCRLVPAGAGALHQCAHEAAEARRIFVSSSLRHRLSEGPRGRGHAPRKGHSAREGLHDLGPSGAEPLRARRVAVPAGGVPRPAAGRPGRSSAPPPPGALVARGGAPPSRPCPVPREGAGARRSPAAFPVASSPAGQNLNVGIRTSAKLGAPLPTVTAP